MTEPLRVLAIGAGAIGTYIGGSLALDGHKVIFVERPDVAEWLRSRGLRLNLQGSEHPIPDPQVAGSIEEATAAQKFDVALFALKSFDTQPFLDSLTVERNLLPPLLCLSNGVDNEPTLSAALGAEKVIPGTVTTAIGRRGAGDIVLERLRGVGVAAGHSISQRLADALDEAGLNAQIFPKAADMKWSKMLTNLIGNATAAILDMPPGEVFAHPGLYQLEIGQLRETLRVMRALNIRAVDPPGTPVRLLAFAVRFLPLAISRPLISKAVGGGRGGKMPSFHIDLHNGRGKSEVDYLNGAVVRAGEKTGIPTPVNRLLRDALVGLTNGEIPLEIYKRNPTRLIRDLEGDPYGAKPSRS
jgi:2-dehydropantoate 2-reductase